MGPATEDRTTTRIGPVNEGSRVAIGEADSTIADRKHRGLGIISLSGDSI